MDVLIDHMGEYLKDKCLNADEQESLNWMLDGILQRMTKEYRGIDASTIALHKMLNNSGVSMTHQLVFAPILSRKRKLIELDMGMR